MSALELGRLTRVRHQQVKPVARRSRVVPWPAAKKNTDKPITSSSEITPASWALTRAESTSSPGWEPLLSYQAAKKLLQG